MFGRFCLTHASLEAVKLPGELSNVFIHFSLPNSLNALLPISTALPSHHIMELYSRFPNLSIQPSYFVWK